MINPCIYTFLPFECLYESGLVYNDTLLIENVVYMVK